MSTLYIDRKNTRLKLQNGALITYINEQRRGSIPLTMLERIVITVAIPLESTLLLKLTSEGIAISLLNPRKSSQQVSMWGAYPKNPHIRLLQYGCQANETTRTQIANTIVRAKLVGHIRFVQQVLQARPDLRLDMQKAIQALKLAHKKLGNETLSIESIRGVEGSAARIFFTAYQHLFSDTFNFTGRNRRPPKDPVNACLSLAYTLLHHRAAQQAYASGLDPMIGFLHDPSYSRESLASDLIEPWRPAIDAWVWGLFRDRYLREHHFSTVNNACLLNKTGRQKFFGAFEKKVQPLSRAIRWQILRFIRHTLKQEAA